MARRTFPKTSTVLFRGLPFELDLVACRHALVQRQVDRELDSIGTLAHVCGVSRSTASRFFSGRNTSLRVTLTIVAALRLKFEDVARPIDPPQAA